MGAVRELRGSRAVCVLSACFLAALFGVSGARAQSASAPVLLSPAPADDGLGERGALLPFSTVTPLRLSLTQGLFPIESKIIGCDSREDASGNSLNGFALERYSYLRLCRGSLCTASRAAAVRSMPASAAA